MPFNEHEITGRLKTSFIGRPLYFHSKIDSTNNAAYSLALKGANEGTVVVADSQEKGKGRLGRRWESPEGVNIYTSIILRPDILPTLAPQITLLAGVSVAETISQYLKKKPSLKWPNDVLLNSKKTAGVLTEMNSDAGRINFIIMGIGINLNMTADMFPYELRHIATSLKEETGKEISREEFLQTLYLAIERWYKIYLKSGFKPICEGWKNYSNMGGKLVRIKDKDREIEGVALTIDDNGYLIIRDESGNIIKIISGDVSV
ncbi:MAG: biotin--[acetyl-CoA-carboxylase] ligase [Deltaproteobacteria bacterium]|nr:biotin--[acetyl-CoA-carboxylase] ligase [Deltaproteobacteria bacterium]